MTGIGFEHGDAYPIEIEQRVFLQRLGERKFVKIDPEITRFCRLDTQLMLAIPGLCKIKRTRSADTAGLSCLLLQFGIQLHGVILKPGDIVVIVQTVYVRCRMPGRTGGQLVALQQYDICPAEFAEMIKNAATDETATDYDGLGVGFHNGYFGIFVLMLAEVYLKSARRRIVCFYGNAIGDSKTT